MRPHRPRGYLGLALATVTAMLTISACASAPEIASSGQTTTVSEHTTPPTTLPVTTPVAKAIPSGATIIYVSTGVSLAAEYQTGLEAAAKVLGWTVKSMTYDPTNPVTITSTVDAAIAEKPAAVVTSAVLVDQLAASIPKARAAGVPIIPALTPDHASEGIYPVLKTDVEYGYAAEILADVIVASADKGSPAKVVQLTIPEVASIQKYQDQAMQKALAAKCSACTFDLLKVPFNDVFSGAYTQSVVSYLQRHPDVNAVVSGSEGLANGLRAALAQSGLSSVKLYGIAPTSVQIKELQQNPSGAWAVLPYRVDGWIIADQVARVLTGDKTDLWDNEHLAYVLTAGNAHAPNAEALEFPASYQDQFKKLWGR